MISVIVPVYKVEAFLPYCVDSLLSQTWTDMEVILVDDGSPDACGFLTDSYQRMDSRVRVVHKANGGLSDARNAGLGIAKGEVIAFVDSDDAVSPHFLKTLYETLKETGADIAECGVRKVTEDEFFRSAYKEQDAPEKGDVSVFDRTEALKLLIEDTVLHQTVWNKLYKRSCLEGVLFPVGKTNEDEFWTWQVFARAQRVAVTEVSLYNYTQRSASIMGSAYSLKRLDALEAKLERHRYISLNIPHLADLSRTNLYGSCIYAAMMTLKFLKKEEKQEAVRRIDEYRKTARADGRILDANLGIRLSKLSFWGTCLLKTITGRGF